ncbi:synaptotagmin-like protein 2 isoform X3 [Rhineura floridana]|uniref:synaptotagmin-like protein 2 isoform X3 n=1 Tax=Rhineura floridana TaxID=261503 RepID=UPI002AC8045F|nr:synaptotagmin-like protein 2 isoform X3 [Rhineura floridana]
MIDLSFLTDEEQEAILKVLQRDAELKRAEEDRVRHLPEKVNDDNQIKNMSGQWFYEAKSKRHREKIHGADIIRASMRRKPLTIAELSQSKFDKTKSSWVNNVNKEVFMPSELLGAIKEMEVESKSNESPKVFSATSNTLEKPQEDARKPTASPSKQRKNPFNESSLPEDNAKNEQPEHGMAGPSEAMEKDPHSPSVENQPKVNVTNHSRVEEPQQALVELSESHRQAGKPPVPKARKNIHKTSDVSISSEESFPKASRRIKQVNGQGTPPRGILKRSSSSSSTDSEVLRLNQILEPSNKSGLPTSTILEGVAEKSPPPGESEGFSQNSLERLKQVRFSSSISKKKRPQSLELHEDKESGEFSLLDSDDIKNNENRMGSLDTLQSQETLPVKPSQAHSPALYGNVEGRGVPQKGEMAPASYSVSSSGLPSSALQAEKSPLVEPIIPSESSSKIFPIDMEEQTNNAKPQLKTKQPDLEPDISKSTTDQQLPKTEDPQVPSVVSADLEQGKPALVEGQSAKTGSKSDKYAAEIVKAADESISKVLDWFKRSSGTDGKEGRSQVPQDKRLAEETDTPKTRELAATTEDNGSSTDKLNLDFSVHEREEPTSKDHRFQETVNLPGKLPLTTNERQGNLLLGDQSRAEELSASSYQEQNVHLSKRTPFQTIDQGANKGDETAMGSKVESEGENAFCKQLKTMEDAQRKGLKSIDSNFGKVTNGGNSTHVRPDGERGIKSFLEGGNLQRRSGESFKELKGKESGLLDKENTQHINRENLVTLQQDKFKEPPLIEDQKKVKDIRAFWEKEMMSPKLSNKEDQLNDSTSGSNMIPTCKREYSRVKPMGGSSGYVTGESDNEQGKYHLVTFRKVELSEDDLEPKDDDMKLPSGKTRPILMDKSKETHVVEGSDKILPSDGKNNELMELLDANNLHPRPNTVLSKESGDLQAVGFEKEKSSYALQQKPHFKIHSLKEQIDKESKAEMLNPSQFQSLRSFWNVGVKPQSRTDEAKVTVVVPRDRHSGTGKYLKESEELEEVRVGTSQAVLEDQQQKPDLQELSVKEQNAKVSHQNVLKASRAVPKQAGQTIHSPSMNTVLLGNFEFAPTEDNYLKEKSVLPVKEYVGKTVVSSKVQHSVFTSGLQKQLKEARQESLLVYPPTDENGVPQAELATEGQMPCSDQNRQQRAVPAAADRNAGPATNEIVESVSRTLVPPKADTGAFNASLEGLLKEASDERSSPSRHIVVDVSEQAVSPSEKMRFFNKVMERSQDSDQKKSRAESWETQGTIQKCVLSKDQPVEFKMDFGNLPGLTEESNLVSGKAPNREGGQMDLNNIPSQEEVVQIPSPKLILPDTCLVAQNRANSPGEEISETVTESNVPSKRQCNDLNAKLACFLKELSKTPSVSPTTQHILTMPFDSIPGEGQQRTSKQLTRKIIPVSPEMANTPREAVSETVEKSVDKNKDNGRLLTTEQGEPIGEGVVALPDSNQKNIRAQRHMASVGEQPKEVAEAVVKTIKPNLFGQSAFKDSLNKLLNEGSHVLFRDIDIPKPAHPSLQPHQHVSSIYDKEVIEIIEKAVGPSNSRQAEVRSSFQNLLEKEDSVVLPHSQNASGAYTESESNRPVDLIGQQEIGCSHEINETVNKTVVPSKLKQREFNSGLRKLLEEAPQVQPAKIGCLDSKMKENLQGAHGLDSTTGLPKEANGTVTKSVALDKDDSVFKSSLTKLMRGSSDAALHLSKEDTWKVTDDSTSQLAKRSPSIKMQTSVERVSSDYRTEVKIPLKGKTLKQDTQPVDTEKVSGVPETNVVFQKTIQVNLQSTKDPLLEKKEDSQTLSREDASENEYERGRETEASTSSSTYLGGSEKVVEVRGSQRSSTPLAGKESPPKTSQVELLLATHHGDDEQEDDEDARSFGSDLSDESHNSFVGIQRSATCSEEDLNPVMEVLKRSSNRQIPSKSLEDIPSATSNKGKVNLPKEDLMLSAEDVSTAPSFPDSQFSHPEKIKRMSKSVPTFLQDESDDRETDTASDSSYPLGRIKKSPSSLTNLSGSSGLASLSSVSTSVMSIYSGDFGNVDVKGNIQFAIDYVEQLKELHIFIAQGKDLAVADVKKQRSDPYVKSYLLPEKYKLGKRKTSVKKKTLNPVYNEILRYKVDKALLASQMLNISVWHNDIFGRNSFLGEVELDLGDWDWNDKQKKQMNWYPLKPRTPLAALELENRGEMKLALQYVPQPVGGKKAPATGEVHIWVKECSDLPVLRGNKLNSFVKCTILPDTSRKSRQKTRAVAKTTNPVFNHTMVYDGFRPEDLKEACIELTVWDHNKLANHFLGGLRIGLGTGKSYGTPVDWMDSTLDETSLWERMIDSPDTWVEDTLPLRILMMAKMSK